MMDERQFVKVISKAIVQEIQKIQREGQYAPIGISARHVHLSKKDVERLFGPGYKLTPLKSLSQPGQFAAHEVVELRGPKGTLEKVRILGPEREKSQVELALSDGRKLGISPPVRASGDLANTPGMVVRGPRGEVVLQEGVIVAERHIHLSPEEAAGFNLKEGDRIRVFIEGKKGGVIEQITVRVNPNYKLDLHLDTDDANAFLLVQGQVVRFEKVNT